MARIRGETSLASDLGHRPEIPEIPEIQLKCNVFLYLVSVARIRGETSLASDLGHRPEIPEILEILLKCNVFLIFGIPRGGGIKLHGLYSDLYEFRTDLINP